MLPQTHVCLEAESSEPQSQAAAKKYAPEIARTHDSLPLYPPASNVVHLRLSCWERTAGRPCPQAAASTGQWELHLQNAFSWRQKTRA